MQWRPRSWIPQVLHKLITTCLLRKLRVQSSGEMSCASSISTGTLTNLARPRCILQSAPSMATLTLQLLAHARCARPGAVSTRSSDASEPPSKRTEGSLKQIHLGLEQLDSFFVRFVICSQKQEGSAMRKRRGSAPGNSYHHNSYHPQVQVNKEIHYPWKFYCPGLFELLNFKWVLPFPLERDIYGVLVYLGLVIFYKLLAIIRSVSSVGF